MSCHRYASNLIGAKAKDGEVDTALPTAKDVHCVDLHYSSGLSSDPD